MISTNLLSISGKKRSGKNQVAIFINELLAERAGKSYVPYNEKAFANLVKVFASMLTGIPLSGFESAEDKAKELGPEWSCYDNLGLKIPMTRRLFLQKLGTDACNMNLHKDTWINGLFQDWTENEKWIITDVRFPQEVQAIKKRSGVVIRVVRPETDNSGDTHASETSLDNYKGFDYIIDNSGTLDDLRNQVKVVLTKLKLI